MSLALDRRARMVFVVNVRGNSVTVIDGRARRALRTVPVGHLPHHVAVNERTGYAFVADWGSDTVSVIAPDAAVARAIPLDASRTGPLTVAVSRMGRVFVANALGNSVSVLGWKNTWSMAVSVGTDPHPIVVDDLHDQVLVGNALDGTISVIDARTSAVVGTVEVGVHPLAIALDSARGRAYIANAGSNSVSVLSMPSAAVISTITVGGAPRAVAVDRRTGRVFAANHDGDSISVIDSSLLHVMQTIPTADGPLALAIDDPRRRLYIAAAADDLVHVVHLDTLAILGSQPVGRLPHALMVEPGSGCVYVANALANTVTVFACEARSGLRGAQGAPVAAAARPEWPTVRRPLPDGWGARSADVNAPGRVVVGKEDAYKDGESM